MLKGAKITQFNSKILLTLASYDLRFFSFQKNAYIEFNVTNLQISFLVGSYRYDSMSKPRSMAAVPHCSFFLACIETAGLPGDSYQKTK